MSDDDEQDLMPAALPVGFVECDDDSNQPPTTGEEYLRRVHKEAKKCPQIVVADIDQSVFKEPTFKVNLSSSILPAPEGYGPSLHWQENLVADFAFVRQSFTCQKFKMKKEQITPAFQIPLKEDVEGWCQLSFGRLHRKPGARPSEGDPIELSSSTGGTPPLMSIVAFLDQPTVMQVLEYHINWFEVTGFSPEQGRWLYALLVCLEKPLSPEACSLLRTLARNCASLRASLESPDDVRLIPLNLIICLVARYFNQMDLVDT